MQGFLEERGERLIRTRLDFVNTTLLFRALAVFRARFLHRLRQLGMQLKIGQVQPRMHVVTLQVPTACALFLLRRGWHVTTVMYNFNTNMKSQCRTDLIAGNNFWSIRVHCSLHKSKWGWYFHDQLSWSEACSGLNTPQFMAIQYWAVAGFQCQFHLVYYWYHLKNQLEQGHMEIWMRAQTAQRVFWAKWVMLSHISIVSRCKFLCTFWIIAMLYSLCCQAVRIVYAYSITGQLTNHTSWKGYQ